LVLKSKLLFCAVNLYKIIDTGILSSYRPYFNKIGNGDGREQTYDYHNEYNFRQRETGFFIQFEIHLI
jgi:hypothetical protein